MTRRARRHTNDAESVEETASPPQPSQPSQEELPPPSPEEKIEQNGTEPEKETAVNETDNCIMTRSRSTTPQVKKMVEQNGHEEVQQEETVAKEEIAAEEEVTVAENEEDTTVRGNTTDTEMDPLVVTDEPDPELVFEENSDAESGRSSPIMTRCKTRRSQTRNIPTPKTPKAEDNETATTSSLEKEDLNATFESCDDISTKAEVGSDSTRLEYMEKDLSNLENNSFLQGAKGKSFGEAMRLLSTRRTIRPIGEDYRRRVLKTSVDRTDAGAAYPNRNSVERVSTVSGLKRKNCEGEDGAGKRFKGDSSGFFSRLTSPLNSIRNSFRSEIASSTPKLTGYKDEKFLIEEDGINSQMCEVRDGERRWCSIM